MPEEIPGAPAPTEPAPSAAPSGGADADVAQGYFDTEIARIHGRLDELSQAMTHLMNAQEMGNGGHRTQQSQAGQASGQRQEAGISASARAGGESVSGATEVEPEPEPEHSPAPSHWYWKSLFGGR